MQRDAAGGVGSAEAALKQAELNLEWTSVRAPISGRISDRRVDAGNLIVGGSTGATLLSAIVSLDPIQFVFDGSEADFIRYLRLAAAGARPSSRDVQNPVAVRLADEKDFTHLGRMDFVDNVLNPKTGTIRGRAIFENKDGLLTPGFFGRLRLFGGKRETLLVPDSAVASDQASKIVFTVADDGTVGTKKVELGPIVGRIAGRPVGPRANGSHRDRRPAAGPAGTESHPRERQDRSRRRVGVAVAARLSRNRPCVFHISSSIDQSLRLSFRSS